MIDVTFVAEWAEYFLVTLLVELGVAVPLLGRSAPLARRVATVCFAQLVSHPAVWFILPALGLARMPYLVVAEGWAIVSELLLYRLVFGRLSFWSVLGVSALANGASLTVGNLLH
jgi:hypothetical protein